MKIKSIGLSGLSFAMAFGLGLVEAASAQQISKSQEILETEKARYTETLAEYNLKYLELKGSATLSEAERTAVQAGYDQMSKGLQSKIRKSRRKIMAKLKKNTDLSPIERREVLNEFNDYMESSMNDAKETFESIELEYSEKSANPTAVLNDFDSKLKDVGDQMIAKEEQIDAKLAEISAKEEKAETLSDPELAAQNQAELAQLKSELESLEADYDQITGEITNIGEDFDAYQADPEAYLKAQREAQIAALTGKHQSIKTTFVAQREAEEAAKAAAQAIEQISEPQPQESDSDEGLEVESPDEGEEISHSGESLKCLRSNC